MIINKIVDYLNENKLDACIFSTPKNIQYITKFECDPHERLLFLIVTKNMEQFLLCPKLEENMAINCTKNVKIIPYLDTENGIEKFSKNVVKIKNVALEKNHITVDRFEKILKYFKLSNVSDCSSLIRDLRKYKNEDEIKCLSEVARLADICIDIAKSNLKEGITELELKSIIENEIKKYDVSSMSFDTIVLFGDNAANPHGVSSNRKLKQNEYVLLDLGCYYKGYASDITRCLEFGKVSDFDKSIYDLVLKANTEAIKAVKPGVSFSTLDKIARDIISNAGYGEYFNHRLGHGLGMDCHEYPDVSSTTNDLLEEGMCFTIEPGVYIPNKVGIRIEDDIIVTKDGYIQLTKYEK